MDQFIPETPESRAEEESEIVRRSLEDFGGFYRQESEDEIDETSYLLDKPLLPPLDHTTTRDDDYDDALLHVSNEKEKLKGGAICSPEECQTPPETPIVSDASTSSSSNSIPVSSLGAHPQQQHQQLNLAYNPYTCHSPNTRRRSYQETLSSYEPPPSIPAPRRLDSEAELEEASREIRHDLLQREIMELAAHAEQAADAGEEHFSAQPLFFTEYSTLKPSSMMRSFSEGDNELKQPLSRRRRTISVAKDLKQTSYFSNLAVVELRDVKEVFPSFQSFHTNLRTHMYRNNVSQLLFTEEETSPIRMARSADEERRKHAFQNFRLYRWVKPRKTVGELVSGHIATELPSSRPKISVPPGLDENAVDISPLKLSSKPTHSDTRHEYDETTVALVDTESCDDQSVDGDVFGDPFVLSTPVIDHSRAKSNSIVEESFLETNSPNFLTPMRLRSIRRPRNFPSADNNLFEGFMLPANSISDDSPVRQKKPSSASPLATVLDVSDSIEDNRDSVGIVLPDFNSSSLESRKNESPRKLKRRSLDTQDLPIMSPSPIQPSPLNFRESFNSILEDAISISRESSLNARPRTLLKQGTTDTDHVVRKSATVDEYSACWTQQRRYGSTLSPTFGVPSHDCRAKSEKGKRALHVRPAENDDFLHNFLYCSKTEKKPDVETEPVDGCEPCNNTGFSCAEPNAGFCCTSILNETLGVDMLFSPSFAKKSQNLVRLGPSSYYARDPENWLDIANERFDAAFESFVGHVDSNAHRHNFRAPTLRKHNEICDIGEDEDDNEKKFSRYDLDDQEPRHNQVYQY